MPFGQGMSLLPVPYLLNAPVDKGLKIGLQVRPAGGSSGESSTSQKGSPDAGTLDREPTTNCSEQTKPNPGGFDSNHLPEDIVRDPNVLV